LGNRSGFHNDRDYTLVIAKRTTVKSVRDISPIRKSITTCTIICGNITFICKKDVGIIPTDLK
jgi:hypothetical protein